MAKFINWENKIFINADIIADLTCGWHKDSWAIFMYINNHRDRYVLKPFQSYTEAQNYLCNIIQQCIHETVCCIDSRDVFVELSYND